MSVQLTDGTVINTQVPSAPTKPSYKLIQQVSSTKARTISSNKYNPPKKAPSRRDIHRYEVSLKKA